jgi:hypothetical protein
MSLDSETFNKLIHKDRDFVSGEQDVLCSNDESLPQIKVDKQSLQTLKKKL